MIEYYYKYGVYLWIFLYLLLAWSLDELLLGLKLILIFSVGVFGHRQLNKLKNKMNMTRERKETQMSWYVIKTQSNKERSVVEGLQIETGRDNLNTSIGKILIPTEKEFAIKNGKRVFKEKIVYPGYIFIQTKALGELTQILKGINGASGFLKAKDGSPQLMRDIEVARMLKDQDMVDSIEIESGFAVNEEVRIIDGAFNTFKGNVESVDQDKQKLKVSVAIFGKKTNLDLNFLQVERII